MCIIFLKKDSRYQILFTMLLQTFAHELGHALNMPHDFINQPGNCQKDSSGNACCNKGTVMDYNQVSNH